MQVKAAPRLSAVSGIAMLGLERLATPSLEAEWYESWLGVELSDLPLKSYFWVRRDDVCHREDLGFHVTFMGLRLLGNLHQRALELESRRYPPNTQKSESQVDMKRPKEWGYFGPGAQHCHSLP